MITKLPIVETLILRWDSVTRVDAILFEFRAGTMPRSRIAAATRF